MDELASKEKNLKDLSTTTINIINKIAIPLTEKSPVVTESLYMYFSS
jgi:hypothetical protein